MAVLPLSINRRALLAAALGLAATPKTVLAEAAYPPLPDRKSLDRAIGEMVVIGFYGAHPAAPGAKDVAEWLRAGLVGGVIFFEDNLQSPEATKTLTKFFREAADPNTPFLCIDQEGGVVSRLKVDRGFEPPLPAAASVASGTPQEAEQLYDRAASELRCLGFNVNFGPVVDLAQNRDSRSIAGVGRSYGTDPATVVDYAKAFIRAHRRNHVLTALKHFPGHGSTAQDSHLVLPNISGSWRKDELWPFAELTNSGCADMVMIGHLVHSDLTEPGYPASLSARAVRGLLRSQLGYNGVVISDDMQMGAVRDNFSADDSILLGIEASVDLFIFSNREHSDPEMPHRFRRVAMKAIESGHLAPERIEQSAQRLAALKRSRLTPVSGG